MLDNLVQAGLFRLRGADYTGADFFAQPFILIGADGGFHRVGQALK